MRQINDILHPRSVAIVGVPREFKTGKLFLMALLDQGFMGSIYPVNPSATEIDGIKAYPSVTSIPGSVDLAIILVPAKECLPVVRDCTAKGVKGAVLFTAGYKELGTTEGRKLEEELVRTARSGGMRLIGPNCMGIYSPKSGLSFFPGLSKKAGAVGLISNSGSLANILCRMAPEKGLYFSTAVSLGNECDLSGTDFLAWFGEDSDTKVIGAYLESVNDARRFLDTVRQVSLKKPVIIWKVGLTPEGAMAASSHTGALAGSALVWQGVVRQAAVVPVIGFEEWLDTLMAFSMLTEKLGGRVAIISGPGGLAVSAAEACGRSGLELAKLSSETLNLLRTVVPSTGTSLTNPIDVGLTASLVMDIYVESARAVAADPSVDAVFVIGLGMDEDTNRLYTESMIEIRRDSGKPFIIIKVPGFAEEPVRAFLDNGLPCFDSPERALAAYGRIYAYQRRAETLRQHDKG